MTSSKRSSWLGVQVGARCLECMSTHVAAKAFLFSIKVGLTLLVFELLESIYIKNNGAKNKND